MKKYLVMAKRDTGPLLVSAVLLTGVACGLWNMPWGDIRISPP